MFHKYYTIITKILQIYWLFFQNVIFFRHQKTDDKQSLGDAKLEEWTLAIGDIIVGIDIGTSKVSLVIGEVNNFNQIEVICTTTHKCNGIEKAKL